MQKWSWTLKEGMGLPEIGESGCCRAGAQVLGVSVPFASQAPACPPTALASHGFSRRSRCAQWGSGAGAKGLSFPRHLASWLPPAGLGSCSRGCDQRKP